MCWSSCLWDNKSGKNYFGSSETAAWKIIVSKKWNCRYIEVCNFIICDKHSIGYTYSKTPKEITQKKISVCNTLRNYPGRSGRPLDCRQYAVRILLTTSILPAIYTYTYTQTTFECLLSLTNRRYYYYYYYNHYCNILPYNMPLKKTWYLPPAQVRETFAITIPYDGSKLTIAAASDEATLSRLSESSTGKNKKRL